VEKQKHVSFPCRKEQHEKLVTRCSVTLCSTAIILCSLQHGSPQFLVKILKIDENLVKKQKLNFYQIYGFMQ